MKQYGSDTRINGISGNVDGDIFFGDIATFKKYGYNSPPPTPEPSPEPPEPPCDCKQLEKHIQDLEDKIVLLEGKLEAQKTEDSVKNDEIEQLKRDLQEWNEKYGTLQIEKNRIENEKGNLQLKYDKLKKDKNCVKILIDKLFGFLKRK
jgi:hypothetical protein